MQPWPLIGAPGAFGFALDPLNPVHGKYSLRETIPLPAAIQYRGFRGMCYIPNTGKPVPVVFSAYVKASANLTMAYISIPGMVSEESYHDKGLWKNGSYFKYITLTNVTEWQRVTFKGIVDPARIPWPTVRGDRLVAGYGIGPGGLGGVTAGKTGQVDFWVDAVQFEIGDQATEFSTE